MLNRIRRLPSPALVISAIALIVAVGGGAFAIAASDNKTDKKIAKKVANKQITKRAPGLSVNHANSADNATHANSADNANNADQLGGVAASQYQRSCQAGAVAAHVYVKGSAAFPATYTSADPPLQDQFNCTGGATKVQVKRTDIGTYFVDFPGVDPANHLVALGNETVSSAGTQDTNDMVTYKLVNDPQINRTVYQVVTADGNGTAQDREFSFSVDG